MTFPAFKEWSVIVEALGTGEQILILRKGGISEGRAGFQVEATRFWLFPTRFHEQLTKTKPAAARWFDPATNPASSTADAVPAPGAVALRYFADIAHTVFLTDWAAIASLAPHHYWTEATVRERFNWSKPAGLHAIVVRIHKLATPINLPITSDMGGCRSWIDLPCAFDAQPASPVLSDSVFSTRRSALSL